MSTDIVSFIETVWHKEDNFHFILSDEQKTCLELMVREPYFIGELGRQKGKTEMCLMYALYISMRYTPANVYIIGKKDLFQLMRKRLEKLMMVKWTDNGNNTFHMYTGSNICFSSEDIENASHVIIDEEIDMNILERVDKNANITILSSEIDEEIKKDKKYCYLRFPEEEEQYTILYE